MATTNSEEARSTSITISGSGVSKSVSINQESGIIYAIVVGNSGVIAKTIIS